MDIFESRTPLSYITEQMEKTSSKKEGINLGVRLITESLKRKKGDKQAERLAPENFSIREMFELFVGKPRPGYLMEQIRESVVSTAFPKATQALISAKIIDAYEMAPAIGDQLVTNFPSNKPVDDVVGVTGTGNPKEVKEGEEYEEISFSEKWTRIGYKKFGRRLSITEETVLHDQTGDKLRQAQDIGEGAKYYKEVLILEGVQDKNSTVYRPLGVATAIYTGATLLAGNAIEDETDIDNIWAKLVALAVGDDANTRKLSLKNGLIFLHPDALTSRAYKIFASQFVPGSGNNAVNPWGADGQNSTGRKVQLISSPILDDSSATTCYMGNFKKQYVWKEVFPFSMVSLPGDPLKDILQTLKVRFAGECGAIDNKWVVKNTN